MWWKERKAPPKLILEEITADQNTSDVSLEKLNNFFVTISKF
jgi:hypothetical protein